MPWPTSGGPKKSARFSSVSKSSFIRRLCDLDSRRGGGGPGLIRTQHERYGRDAGCLLPRRSSCLSIATAMESTLGDATQPQEGWHWLAALTTADPCRVARHPGHAQDASLGRAY